MAAYIKSALWLFGCGGVGYMLLEITTPSEEYVAKVKKTYPVSDKSKSADALKNKQKFIDVLKAATESDQSLYRYNTKQTGKFLVQVDQPPAIPSKED